MKLKRGKGVLQASAGAADRLALMGAAYLLSGRAIVLVAKSGAGVAATLEPVGKETVAGLAEELARAFENQRARWAQAKAALAAAPAVEKARAEAAAFGTLSPERQAEIARLLAEAEADPVEKRDALKIRTPWEQLA